MLAQRPQIVTAVVVGGQGLRGAVTVGRRMPWCLFRVKETSKVGIFKITNSANGEGTMLPVCYWLDDKQGHVTGYNRDLLGRLKSRGDGIHQAYKCAQLLPLLFAGFVMIIVA